jgi:hypothetical protein
MLTAFERHREEETWHVISRWKYLAARDLALMRHADMICEETESTKAYSKMDISLLLRMAELCPQRNLNVDPCVLKHNSHLQNYSYYRRMCS